MEPLLAKAARKLGVDQVAIRRINAPAGKAPIGGPVKGKRDHVTSAFVKEALDRGAELFRWDERKAQPKRIGSKVRGVGVAVSAYSAGTVGFDGGVVIKPDGRPYIPSGVGNLGTESRIDVHRVVAEMLDVLGTSARSPGKHRQESALTCSFRRQPDHPRNAPAARCGAIRRQEKVTAIAAMDLGGNPEDYDVGGGRVFEEAAAGRADSRAGR